MANTLFSFCFVFDVSCTSHEHMSMRFARRSRLTMRTRSHRQTCHVGPLPNGIPNNYYQGLACALYIHTCTFRYSPAEHHQALREPSVLGGRGNGPFPATFLDKLAAARKNSRSSLCRWSIFLVLVEVAVLAVSTNLSFFASKNINGVSPFGAFSPSSRVPVTEPPPLVGRRRHGPASR
ncbi:hypothetical protein GGI42DRAFT_321656 [Trichoderma sp. SZMC 28013]